MFKSGRGSMIYDESAYLFTLKRGKFTKGKEENLGGAYSE